MSKNDIPTRAAGAVLVDESGSYRCLALNAKGERCQNKCGPDDLTCGVHTFRITMSSCVHKATLLRSPRLFRALEQIASSNAGDSKDIALEAIESVKRRADEFYQQRIDAATEAGWSQEEIAQVSR